MRSKVKPEVEFQYGGRLYIETGNSYMSAADWVIITKFGLLIETDIQKRVTSPEVKLHRSGQHLENQYNIYISFEEWGWTDFEEIRQPNAECSLTLSQWRHSVWSTHLSHHESTTATQSWLFHRWQSLTSPNGSWTLLHVWSLRPPNRGMGFLLNYFDLLLISEHPIGIICFYSAVFWNISQQLSTIVVALADKRTWLITWLITPVVHCRRRIKLQRTLTRPSVIFFS